MDKKKTLEAVFSALVLICILGFAGAVYSTHIIATFAVVVVACIHAVKSIKKLGK